MPDLESVLPLSRSQLYLLLAIQEGERHGYAVKKRVEELSGGVVRMGPGTLYTAIQRAEEQGLIRESKERPPEEEDQSQRRYYVVTPLGRDALASEVDRLGDFVTSARSALSEV
ncbi:MAG: helix-turn-helix transcriptional regulator [Gemmatimonadetes bacterium]|nr:PadR family transcriptional regulator [Gemmatimonadota bacterium]NNF14372.1 helix-turn-helix transcriptional regulator [Gemmatimonadota bacterium]NNL31151.1 helix-turn-helix transcriptional regulator [Gemmatimonadota bacterium]